MKHHDDSFARRYNITQLRMREPHLKVPSRFGGWIQGFVNGRTGTAAVDPKSSVVHSGYIQAFFAGYHNFTAQKKSNLSATVTSCYASLADLLLQYHQLREQDSALSPNSAEAIRAERNRVAKRADILRDIIRLQALLIQNIQRYNCSMEASANKLSRGIAWYCKGVLFRTPVRPESLPTLEVEFCEPNRDFPELKPILQEIGEILTITETKEVANHGEKSVV